jgi:hypothetical protein
LVSVGFVTHDQSRSFPRSGAGLAPAAGIGERSKPLASSQPTPTGKRSASQSLHDNDRGCVPLRRFVFTTRPPHCALSRVRISISFDRFTVSVVWLNSQRQPLEPPASLTSEETSDRPSAHLS